MASPLLPFKKSITFCLFSKSIALILSSKALISDFVLSKSDLSAFLSICLCSFCSALDFSSFKILILSSEAGINIEMISTSEIRISVICRVADLEKGVKAAHSAFDLDADGEAVVYGGTGR